MSRIILVSYLDVSNHADRDVGAVDSFVVAKGLPHRDVSFFGAWVSDWDEEPCGLYETFAVVFVVVEV